MTTNNERPVTSKVPALSGKRIGKPGTHEVNVACRRVGVPPVRSWQAGFQSHV